MSYLKSVLGGAWARVKDEPVMTLAIVQAALAVAVSFGLGWSGEQVGGVVALSAATLGWIARRQVTPV